MNIVASGLNKSKERRYHFDQVQRSPPQVQRVHYRLKILGIGFRAGLGLQS